MKKFFLLLNLFAAAYWLNAQNIPDTQWTKTIDGGGWEWCNFTRQTSDGGYIMAGRTNGRGAGNLDAWVVKTDVNGDTLWTKTWGDTFFDEAYNINETSDGGFIICGISTAFGWSYEGWLILTDADGNTIWSKGYHPLQGSTAGADQFMSVYETSDHCFVAAGFGSVNDAWQAWIVKVNIAGDVIWNKVYGVELSFWERIDAMEPTADGGYIAVGDRHVDHGGAVAHDGWLIKFNSEGDTLWTRTFGGEKIELLRSVQELEDGFIICGEKEKDNEPGYDGYVIRTDENGDEKWSSIYETGALLAVQQMEDGNFFFGGTKPTATNGYEAWMLKLDDNGAVLDQRTYDLTPQDEMILSVQKTDDGGYILSGRYNSSWMGGYDGYGEYWLVKLESDGNTAVTTLSENFDDVTNPFLPEGWTGLVDVLISNTFAEVKTTEHSGAPSAPNAVFIMNGLDGSNGQLDPTAFTALVSPLVQVTSGDTLRFWASGGNPVVVGTLTDPNDASTFTAIQEIAITFDFTEYIVVLNTPGSYHLAFKNGNLYTTTPVFVDQITLTSAGVTGVENELASLDDFTLEQNYPNPFNPSTTIRFSLTNNSKVNLTVYDALGKEITVLVDRNLTAGTHEVNFNAAGLNSGVYFYRINVSGSNENYTSVRKMIFLK